MSAVELTHPQKQIWVGQRLHPEIPLYNMAFAFLLGAELRPDAFREAWRLVAERSDVLRMRFADGKGGLRLTLDASVSETAVLDFSERPDPVGEFRRWCRERCARPFSLEGDLVESVLVRLGPARTGWYLNQHHLVTDAWSTRLLYEAVGAEYEARLRGNDAVPAPFAPYYPTSRALASREFGRARALEHWAARADRPGRSVPLYGGSAAPVSTASERSTLELDEDRSRALDRLAREEGFVSASPELSRFALFATLLVSWLHRVSGRSDLGFDAPVAGRPTAEAKCALGLFIEMFPFAVSVAPRDSFRSLGARCLEEAKLFLRHALPATSAPTGATASNVVLNYFPASFGPFDGLPAEVSWVHPGYGDSVHTLRIQVHDFSGSGRYTLHFDVNEMALPSRLRRRALQHFEKLLDACLDDPDRPLAEVDVLVEEERQGLAALDATEASPLPDRTVVARFLERSAREPHRVALRQGEEELTFAEVRGRVEALAASLVRAGVEPGDRVAILSRRSALFVVAVLAALRARAAYVPIEASVPRARLETLLEDSGARMLLLGEGIEPSPTAPDVIVLSIAEAVRAGEGLAVERPGPELSDLAYLMYTSGSTGRPKGVLVEHGGLADYLLWAERQYVRGDRLAFPLFTSVAFDLTVTSLFLPLLTGGVLEIYPESVGPADTALFAVVAANAVDFIKLTPSHLSLLRRVGLAGSRIRRMVVGGEDLKSSLAASVSAELHGEVEIVNEYGPTEAVVGCMIHRYDPERDLDASVPIGGPADHVALEVLNEAQTPVPEGVPGELWIARFGNARGYHGLDELTAERFQPHPRLPKARRYRTGDLVRMVAPGELAYLGRIDRQLKVSGLRVEPGEVEAALLELPGIEQCAVVARQRPASPPRANEAVRHCVRCGLASNYPRAVFDETGVCSLCRAYESIQGPARAYFRTMEDLQQIFDESARAHAPKYDCLMLYSGGKDSTYALCRLVDKGLSVYAFTLDNGFISEGAKENIRRVSEALGVPVELATTEAMPAIFRDSLNRFANVCNGCFKTIYTLSLQRARELEIPIIVTGLSRGQMFETRLTEEMFRDGGRSPAEIDDAVLAARKIYHRVPDAVTRSLGVDLFEDDRIFEQVRFVDFYRYCDVGMRELFAYLRRRVPWVRPEDTGRSTNCLINDVGIYVHKMERGYHNYALPYSWDVRLGHKERAAALEELDDDIDVEHVQRTLAEIGYDPERMAPRVEPVALEAFYVASQELSETELRRLLGERLPAPLVPAHLQRVDELPLTASGKVDEEALSRESFGRIPDRPYRAPEGPVEEYLAQIWQEELFLERVGADDSFFELGGTSLSAMQVMLRICQEYDLDLPLDAAFSHPRLRQLAKLAEDRILADVDPGSR